MQYRFFLLTTTLVLVATASVFAQPTREELTLKKSQATLERESKEVEAEARIPAFEFKESLYSRSTRRPDIFHAVATILTKDIRLFKDYLVTDVIWEYETGNMLCLQAEPPSTTKNAKIFYASEIRSVTIRSKNGQFKYYVYDDKQQKLRPAMRGINVEPEMVARYEFDRRRRALKFGPGAIERIQPTKEEVANCGLERVEIRFTK